MRVAGFVDFAHAARTQRLNDLEWTDFRTAIQTHDRITTTGAGSVQ